MPNWFEQLPEVIQEVIMAADTIVSDFDVYGEVLQIGDDDEMGVYGPNSPIERLRTALKNLEG